MMKMVIDVRMWNHSGIGTYIKSIIPRVISAFPDVHFYLIKDINDYLNDWIRENPQVEYINFSSSIYSVKEQLEFIKKLPKKYDLIWAPHFNIPFMPNGKLLVTIHDVFHLANPQFVSRLQKMYANVFFNRIKGKAEKIITVSNFTKCELMKYKNIHEDKMIPVYNGVEPGWFMIPSEEKVHSKPYILYVGNVKPHKNLKSLVKAFEKIKDKISHDLVIVGKKEGFIVGDDEVTKIATTLGDRVYFTGYIDDDMLMQYYAQADVFVFPSMYEGFGLPPLEAMAAGCPTIVSNRASIPEICKEASLYCDPLDIDKMAETILSLIADDELKASLIVKGKEVAKQFSWEKSAEETIDVIKGVLK